MADSARLVRGFSYASAIPNHSKQGNAMHVLGESVSFGRFTSEPLSWEKWSAFSNKKYVEEAKRFAQPGSVAAKAAFFEAHYKRIAAEKALALLEQESAAAKTESEEAVLDYAAADDDDKNAVILNYEFDGANDSKESSVAVVNGNEGKGEKISVTFSENIDSASCSEGSGTPQMEKPLLKNSVASEEISSSATSKKKSGLSALKSSIQRKTWKVPNPPDKPVTPQLNNATQSTETSDVDSVDKKKSAPKSLHGLSKLIPTKAPDKEPISAIKKDTSSGTPKDSKTPMRTPIVAAIKSAVKYPTSTPKSENTRMKTPNDPSTTGSKSSGPKWHILSTVCSKSLTACRKKLQSPSSAPTSSVTPFILRTEERAAKRKQKLEEKFNADEANKAQIQKTLKEKAGNEIRKLSCGFCFKARPLPDFYKEREKLINQTKKNQSTQLDTPVLGRSVSIKKQGSTASTTTPAPPKPLAKINGLSKNPSTKNVVKPSKRSFTTACDSITHENKSPNIQH